MTLIRSPRTAAAVLIGLLSLLTACSRTGAPPAAEPVVQVYKSPSCQCCAQWVTHLQQAGFTVQTHDQPAMNPLKTRLGVPQPLWSCHTAEVDGYVIEGHVPAQDIRRLLTQRPQGRGLSVPGMPVGSPGMEQGTHVDPYEVLLFDDAGATQVFATHGP